MSLANSTAVQQTSVDDLDCIEQIVRGSGTSFYWAMRLLPEAKRRAMFAIYAYCREVDDIADDPGEEATKRRRLTEWREEIDKLYAGVPTWRVSRTLLEPMRDFGLRKEDFLAIIDGMETDAADSVRIADLEELRLYCDRVACAVGRLSNRVFGVPEPPSHRLASALGQALQLTNILRDLDEDAHLDRLYLPRQLLEQHGIASTEDVHWVLMQPALAQVLEQVAEIARQRFTEAAAILAECDRRKVRPAVIMMEVYRRTLQRLKARGWRRLAEPVSVSTSEKLWIALRHGVI
jgi:phytoene synthase